MDQQGEGEFVVRGQVDVSRVEEDIEVPLRVAAVQGGTVLASQALERPNRAGKFGYELRFRLPSPCGFHVLVGRADVSQEVLLASELARVKVAAPTRASEAMAAKRLEIAASDLVVEAARYSYIIGLCRKYRVRGRVVCRHWRFEDGHFHFCDDPVPGATVEVYDVDRLWFFSVKDLVTTATTGIDGTFEAEFTWCCLPWRPWFDRPWYVDPELLHGVRLAVDSLRARVPVPIPDPPPDPAGLESFVRSVGTALQVAQAKPTPGTALAQMSDVEVAAGLQLHLPHLVPNWPWRPRRDCAPDLLLRATQKCGGSVQVIYEEGSEQTPWNAPTDVSVTILANDKACCIPACDDPDCDDCFKFTNVGSTPVQNIGGNDPVAPVADKFLGVAGPGGADLLFGGTLDIFGTLGSLADLDYYELEDSTDDELTWSPLPAATLAPLEKSFWGVPCGGVGIPQWNPISVVPEAIADTSATVHHVYQTRARFQAQCPGAPWEDPADPGSRWWDSRRDRALVWTTSKVESPPQALAPFTTFVETPQVPDGLHRLRVIGWKINAANQLTDRRVVLRCNTLEEERLLIRLDNRTIINHPASTTSHPWGPGYVHIGSVDPDCDFVSIVRNEGQTSEVVVDACSVVELSDTDSLTVHFLVSTPPADNDRHLGGYWMTVHHGESAYFDAVSTGVLSATAPAHPGRTYASAVTQGEDRRWWGGGNFSLKLPGSAFEETCAYLFRLHAYKRVFNGSTAHEYFHANDAEFSFTINKI